MSTKAIIGVIILIAAIMFAPLLLADGLERFFTGLGTILGRWMD